MKKNNSLSSQLYLLSSILLFLLAIVSIVRMELNQTAIAGDPPKEPWVDGRVYRLETKEGQSTPVYISTQGSECGVNEGEIKVSDSSIDRCDSKGRPYYLLEEVKEGQNTFQLQIPAMSEYMCDSWVAVESRDTSNVIARGKCTGAYTNEATYDNQGKNTTLWWKLKPIEITNDGDGDSSGIKPLEQPDYAGFGTNEGDTPKAPDTTFSCSDVTQISQTECEALVALYDSTGGDNWTNIPADKKWKQSNTPCTDWEGVSCVINKINGVRLYRKNLSGTIPTQLGNLSILEILNLSYNQLTGTIPTQLGNLSNLRILYLEGNQLTGTIPIGLGNLSYLEYLDLGKNELTGTIPTQLGNLSNLKYLGLYSNELTGTIPTQIGNLLSLRSLRLYNNQLVETIPTELGNLSNLETLALSDNRLTGIIPIELGNLSNLETLLLFNNRLTGTIPTQLGNLSNLKYLGLSNNQLTGTIPAQMLNLISLEQLSLFDNQLTGAIPFYDSVNHLPLLRHFYYYNNTLCLNGGSTGQTADWLRAVEARDPNTPNQVNPSPENAITCAPTSSADLVPLSNTVYQNGVQFTSATNALNVGVKNEGTAGTSNFNIKGVIVTQPVTTPAQFNTAYAISTNPKGLVNIETIGTTSNNPKLATMSLGSTNLSQHANKYMCIFVDGGDGNNVNGTVSESNENNNIGCRQIPAGDTQFVDLQPYTGVGGSSLNYSGGIAFYTNSSNTISVGVKNHGNQSATQLFQIKGVVSQSAITTIDSFNNTYNSAGSDIKKSVSLTGIGTGSTNNPKFIDMSLVTNWAQHYGKYLCVYIDSALAVNENGYENNNIGCRQIPNNTQKPDLRGFTGSYSNKQYTYGASFIENRTLGFAVKNVGQNTSIGQFKVRAFLTNDSVTGVTSGNFIDKWNQSQVALRSESTYSNNISTNAIGIGSMVFSLPVSVTIKSYTNLCIKFDAESSLTGNIVETDEWNNMGCIQTSQFGAPDLRILTNTYNGKVYTKGLAKGSTVNQVDYAVKNIGQSATQTYFNIKIFFTNDDVSSVTSGNFFTKYNLIPDSQKRSAQWLNNLPVGSIISNAQTFGTGFNYNNYQNVCIKFDSEETLVGRIPESDEWNNFGCGRVVDLLR